MRKLIFLQIIRKLTGNPQWKRSIRNFVGVGIIGFFLIFGLVIWAGVGAFNYVSEAARSAMTQEQPSSLPQNNPDGTSPGYLQSTPQADANSSTKLNSQSCLSHAKTLLSAEVWLDKPIRETFRGLKIACFQPKPITPVDESWSAIQSKQVFVSK